MNRGSGRPLVFENTLYGSSTATLRVPTAGHRWEGGDEPRALEPVLDGVPAGRWLVENEPADGEPWGERVAPLGPGRVPRLAADFAALKTPRGYLAFANRWGRLGHRQEREWLATWEKETRRALVLTTLMKWLRKGDRERLRSVVAWTAGSDRPAIHPGAALGDRRAEATGGVHWLGPRLIVEADVLVRPDGRPRWAHGDVAGPAHFYVCDEINKALKGHVHTRLMPFAEDRLFRVYVVPDCLRAAIYYQLQLSYARGLVGPKSKECARDGCGVHFDAIGNKRYCSPACQKWGKSRRQARWRRLATGPELPQSLPQSRRTALDGSGSERA